MMKKRWQGVYKHHTEELAERIKEAKDLKELFPEALANEEFVEAVFRRCVSDLRENGFLCGFLSKNEQGCAYCI